MKSTYFLYFLLIIKTFQAREEVNCIKTFPIRTDISKIRHIEYYSPHEVIVAHKNGFLNVLDLETGKEKLLTFLVDCSQGGYVTLQKNNNIIIASMKNQIALYDLKTQHSCNNTMIKSISSIAVDFYGKNIFMLNSIGKVKKLNYKIEEDSFFIRY